MAASTPSYLLDTNVVSALFHRERLIQQRLREVDYFLPFAVVGELYVWTRLHPALNRERLTQLHGLLSVVAVLPSTVVTSERYSLIYDELKRQGLPIPVNDMWIAAQALEHGLTIATRDSDFIRIAGLMVERW